MKHPVLNAEARTILGKKVKKLRKQGLVPANIYGKALESKAIQVSFTDFQTVYKEAGETGVIDLKVDGQVHPVLVKNLQMNFKAKAPMHVDFYQVNLKEKVKAMVPIKLIGEAQAVTDKVGMLMQVLSEVEVESLPDKIPGELEIDVTPLAELGANLTVADLKLPEGVVITNEPTQPVVQIAELVVEEPPAEEASAEGEAAEGGETPAEGASEEKSEESSEGK
jgi:large subunit ribosomal protein L25